MNNELKRVAMIAHDGRKAEMVGFFKDHMDILSDIKIVATGTTGSHLVKAGLEVDCKLSGPKGGDAQIAAMVAEGDVDAVFFFRDPLGKHPHEPDVQMLMRVCDLYDVPLATNPASGQLLMAGIRDVFKK
ncbi:methylglyoxal synthase [Flammeovirga yaeyamensis]|uniref:Methylglyoxal synthase n=1 Tax=Flammeovirga yaeyamensis TaxID=367791 RepID=A0AAX1N218_9BACT|nr:MULTISPECIES: methylglyoxal synthase [Flammeovirga]ANQ48420.1 methylglyoxal synthase [Flammeovirga sp. MY04]MBB3696324.1 methylglyoxal synthase [Flammeovirga yaeyamensis]NMF35003.1 methylglyoxal synthase [Flammeovirga yaeyamensis]QWG00170.1 methylglyoxal synthase [Flammeovirga yaeyamensis]